MVRCPSGIIQTMRIKLSSENLSLLFEDLGTRGYDISKIASIINRHERTLRDWRRGKYLLDSKSYSTLTDILGVDEAYYCPTYIDEIEQRRAAGKIGGQAVWQMYGSIGSLDSKTKGGKKSYNIRKDKVDIFSRKKIIKPRQSNNLAEFIGICMGDGSLTDYQLVISFNRFDDAEYVSIVRKMIFELFGYTPSIQERKDSKCTNLVVSSVELVEYLTFLGLPKGDKLRSGLDIPDWVKGNQEFTRYCIRGLIDTDGSIYQEVHKAINRVYAYPRLSFVSASDNLRKSVNSALSEIGIESRIRMNRNVNIERFTDINKYFRIIGSSNPKHLRRFAKFGEVA